MAERMRAPRTAAAAAKRTVTVWLLRTILTLSAGMAVAQPVLAGSYLSGSFDAIGSHGVNGSLLVIATAAGGVVAVAHRFTVGGSWWLVITMAVLVAACVLQVGLGFQRVLLLHLPLGVGIVALLVTLAVWSWTPSAGATRPGDDSSAPSSPAEVVTWP